MLREEVQHEEKREARQEAGSRHELSRSGSQPAVKSATKDGLEMVLYIEHRDPDC
jgi:hypothetical protein